MPVQKKDESEKLTEHFQVQDEEDTVEHVPQIHDPQPTEEENVEKRRAICQPINLGRYIRWFSQELEILHEVKNMPVNQTMQMKYDAYKTSCASKDVPFRTFRAFKFK